MLQFRHQTKQLCVVDVAHSIHLILGSSNKPIEVTPANPPNSLSTQHRSKLDLSPLSAEPPARSLTHRDDDGANATVCYVLMMFFGCVDAI